MVTTNRQEEQRLRNERWLAEYGGIEAPVQISTYLSPQQQARIQWIRENVMGSVLEVGCSWGYILTSIGGQVGVDLSPQSIEIAKALNRSAEFHVADARNLSFPAYSYDTVLLAEILEHIEYDDVKVVLSEACRIAREQLIITIPDGNEDSVEALNPKHKWLCTSERLAEVLSWLPVRSREVTQRDGFMYIIG